jgi:pyruvate,water dikinase
MSAANKNVIWFEDLSRGDVGLVGGKNSSSVAVRSSATAEDLPTRVSPVSRKPSSMCAAKQGAAGHLPPLLRLAVHRPGDHLPQDQGFDHEEVALSIGVQLMVRSDIGGPRA